MGERTIICPTCKKESVWDDNPYRPFCSERCRLVDLGKWASEEYRIAGEKKVQSEKSDDDNEREQ